MREKLVNLSEIDALYAEDFLDLRETIEVGSDSDDLRCSPPYAHTGNPDEGDGVIRMPRAQWSALISSAPKAV